MTLRAKPKQCSFCGEFKPLWKSHPPTCKDCHGKNCQAELDGVAKDVWSATAIAIYGHDKLNGQ